MGAPPHADPAIRSTRIQPSEVYSCAPPLAGYVTPEQVAAYMKVAQGPCHKKRKREAGDDEGGDPNRRCYMHEQQLKMMRSYSFRVVSE